jgi:hypothetical protein
MGKLMKQNGDLNILEVIKVSIMISVFLCSITSIKNQIELSQNSLLVGTLASSLFLLQTIIIFTSIVVDVVNYIKTFVVLYMYNQKIISKSRFDLIKNTVKQVFDFKISIKQFNCVFRC